MFELTLMLFGVVILMYLSGLYRPAPAQLEGRIRAVSRRHNVDVYMWIVILWMTCFMFLRTRYNDTETYISFWKNAPSVKDFILSGSLLQITGNPLSDFWQSLSKEISNSYHVYFLLPAILLCFVFTRFFKDYSVNPAFSFVVFFSTGSFILYMAALKQGLSVFFLVVSLPFAIRREYGKFYLILAVAVLFHTHCFLFAIIPFLFDKPWGKITWIGLAAVLLIMLTYDTTMGAFMEFAQSIGAQVVDIEVFDGHSINLLRIVVYWIPALLALIFRDRLFFDSSRTENLFVNMSIVSACILTIGLVQAANLFARMAANFEFAIAISLPWILNKLLEKRSATFFSVVAAFLYLGYYLYEFGISKSFGSNYSAISLWQFIVELFTL